MPLTQRHTCFILTVALLINAFPVISVEVLTLTDAGAHLYNAQLLLHLTSPSSYLHNYLEINSWTTPNWTGHLFLAGLLSIGFSVLAAQKTFLIFYVIAFPGFAMLFLHELTKKWSLMFLLILPATYTSIFALGFFNFLLGLTFLMLGAFLLLKLTHLTS